MTDYYVWKSGFGYLSSKQTDSVRWVQSQFKATKYKNKDAAKVAAKNVRGTVVS